MANIAEFLKKIAEARYGKDVRDSIHDGIEAINCEVETNTEASNNAVNAAKASATSATNAEAAANKAKEDVAAVKQDIYDTAIPQIQQLKTDTETIKAETQQLKTDTEGIKDDTQQIKTDTASIEKACAKYAEKCENATAGLDGGTIPCGSVTFEELPDLADVKRGWMYNVSDEFMTTDDFLGGADFYYPPGTNVCAILNDGVLKWDCFGGEMSGYLMKRDIESTLAEAKIEFDEPEELKVTSGITTIKNLFGNVSKIIKLLGKTDLSNAGDDITSILHALITTVGSTDISGIGDGTIKGAISVLNSDKAIDLTDGAGTAVLSVCGKMCLLTFNAHPVDAELGSFKSLANLVPEKYRPKRYYDYSSIFALFKDKYYMVYTGFAPSGGWSGYGVATSSDGYIYLTGRSLWNGTVMWLC